MKTLRYSLALMAALGLMCTVSSCEQDLGQNPPFNYPTGGSTDDDGNGDDNGDDNNDDEQEDTLPAALYSLSFEDELALSGTLSGTLGTYDAADPVFETGKVGKAWRGADGQALVLRPDAASVSALGALKSFTVAMWIKFDGSNDASTCLFAVGSRTDGVGNLAFFINNGNKEIPGNFYFKGYYMTGSGSNWFDLGGDTTIGSMANVWSHVALSFDGDTSTMTLWRNGTSVASYTWDGVALGLSDISGISLGAYPSQVGLTDAGDWTKEADFYTGLLDEVRFYDVALTAEEMITLYKQVE